MQSSKCFLVVCAAACCTAILPLRAADADTDTKLREALEKKLNELQTQPATAAPQPSATTPKPKTPTPSATIPAPIVPTPADSEAMAKARQALRQKMTELQAQPGGRPTPPAQWTPPPVVQALAVRRATNVRASARSPASANRGATAPPPSAAGGSGKHCQGARDLASADEGAGNPAACGNSRSPSLAEGGDPQPGQKPVEAKPQETASKPEAQPKAEKVLKKPAKAAPAFPPIQAPPPAISADKDARLAELLRKYKADEITPEEYHQQRAKILSAP